MGRQRRTSAEWDAVIRDARQRGLTATDVADRLGVALSTVVRCAALRDVRLTKRLKVVLIRDPLADKDYTLEQLSDITGLPRKLLYNRYRAGYSFEELISPR